MPYAESFTKAGCRERVEGSVRERRLCFAGIVDRMRENMLQKRGPRGTPEDESFDWLKRLQGGLTAFGIVTED